MNTVAKRMKEHGIASVVERASASPPPIPTTTSRCSRTGSTATSPPTPPNQKWAADITYIPTGEGFVYLAGVVDLFSRRIVGWSMKDTLHADLCVEALEMALAARRPKHPLLHHSDRGCQYAGEQYQDTLADVHAASAA